VVLRLADRSGGTYPGGMRSGGDFGDKSKLPRQGIPTFPLLHSELHKVGDGHGSRRRSTHNGVGGGEIAGELADVQVTEIGRGKENP